jgi:hypothetical protein
MNITLGHNGALGPSCHPNNLLLSKPLLEIIKGIATIRPQTPPHTTNITVPMP